MATERKKIIKKLDEQFSKAIRQRDKRCQRCYKTDNLQCAHIFTRSKLSTRWDELNAVTLCGGCHIFWGHKEPLEFYDWIRERLGDTTFKALRLKSNLPVKFSTPELRLLLQNMIY